MAPGVFASGFSFAAWRQPTLHRRMLWKGSELVQHELGAFAVAPRSRRPWTLLAWLAVLMLGSSPADAAAAQAASIVLTWNASPDSDVAGYRVYVGTDPATYASSFFVGSETSFVYTGAAAGVRYYFAVASYTRTGLESSLSAEVSALAAPPRQSASDARAVGSLNATSAPPSSRVCDTSGRDCYVVERLAAPVETVGALAAVPNGGLLFIEAGRRVNVLSRSTGAAQPALVAPDETTLIGIRLDPRFVETGFVFIGEVSHGRGGEREFSIARYRAVRDTLGERAAIVAGIAVPGTGDVPFALDADGRFYVAIPAATESAGRRDPYEGAIVRFDPDGRAAGNVSLASPLLALGFASPSALEWDPTTRQVWLAGRRAEWVHRLARFEVDGATPPDWPTVPRAAAAPGATASGLQLIAAQRSDTSGYALWLASSGELTRVGPDASVAPMRFLLDPAGSIRAMAASEDGSLFVVSETTNAAGAQAQSILRLRR
jgi:hypothetical protein